MIMSCAKCYMQAKCLTKDQEIIKSLFIKISECQSDEARLNSAKNCQEKAKNGNFYDFSKISL